MNGGQIIAHVLLNHKVKHLFTLSGGHIAPIYVEAEKAGIKIIDVRHEASAVFAADAQARMSGIIGVAAVTAGPGVTNTITALKNAQLAESPVLLLGGAAATLLKGRGALQDIDQMALVRPHVKYATRITRLSELKPKLKLAIQAAKTGVSGPVFVECPMDLLYEETLVRDLYAKSESSGKTLQGKLRNWYIRRHVNKLFQSQPRINLSSSKNVKQDIPSALVSKAEEMINSSEQPVLLIGSGAVKNVDTIADFAKAVESLGIPVFLGGMARGLLGKSKVQYFHQRTKALKASDCIILAGIPCDFRLNYGGHFSGKAQKIAVSKNKIDLHKNLRADIKVCTDPALFLMALSDQMNNDKEKWSSWHQLLRQREEERNVEIKKMSLKKTADINPVHLFLQLDKMLPDNSILIADGGDFAATAAYTLRPRAPLKWLDPGVFGTLGSGGGFAMGAALRYPDHYIWIIYGDGSSAYSLMEMDTFRKFGMKVCGIIGNNGSWEQIARDQVHILERDTASVLPQSDYEKIAHAFGAEGEKVNTMEAFTSSVERAMQAMDRGEPYLINAMIGTTDFRKGSMSM